MMDSDPFRTQRDVGSAVVAELSAAGFDDADEIGRGGFGIVYRCTQGALDRTVAVKVLTADLDDNRARFVREQRAMGRLTGHPNIVSVLQVGETANGYPYLVMPYHRQGSLEARIKRLGLLPLDEVLRFGVKMAGALESAHRHGILHRDVKPGNILFTDYGEPALSDFGIAHISGGFKTATGIFVGSPAFTAPETLSGDPPSTASDVYGLGATLFCALTGHAAYERRSGEQVVAQFLRIATEAAPDLRNFGIAEDVSAVVENAMCRDPSGRPSAAGLGEELQRVEERHGVAVDEMALRVAPNADPPESRAAVSRSVRRRRPAGNLPLELSSFVGRRSELAEVQRLLAMSRLVTLTGIGGVGKTRLALRAADAAQHDFPDGVWLAELAEVRDASLLVDVTAAAVGLRDESGLPLRDVLVEALSSRKPLLVLDNCEQVIEPVAELAETLLRECPQVRILATSREALGITGESVLRLSPLVFPDLDSEHTLREARHYDAVALFAERAATALPGFTVTEDNSGTVARICSRLDGLPLAIELAAARLRAMSLEQILQRLADRYTLLTRGSRSAPTRQQTLRWCIDWSYELCTPAEQQLWARLSVFAGSFELEAAEDVCGPGLDQSDVLDLLSALVDKSILSRMQAQAVVRFRLLETLRAYGREQLDKTGQYGELRRRHRDWYHRLALDADAGWFSSRQLDWMDRLERELPNLREALEFSLSEDGSAALAIGDVLQPFWVCRGMLSEGRRWLDRALSVAPEEPTIERARALYGDTMMAELQGDPQAANARVKEGLALVETTADPSAHGLIAFAEGYSALLAGDFDRASICLKHAIKDSGELTVQAGALVLLGFVHAFRGNTAAALARLNEALALSESCGESVYRGYAMWAMGIITWRLGEPDRAAQLLRQGLGLAKLVNDPRNAAACMEVLALISGQNHNPRLAVVLMSAADTLSSAVGSSALGLPNLLADHHKNCELRAREALDGHAFEAARREGRSLSFDAAIAYALEHDPLGAS